MRQAPGDEVDFPGAKKRSSEGKIMTGSFLKPPGFDFRSSCKGVCFFCSFETLVAILVDVFFLSGHKSEPSNRSLGRLSILEVEPLISLKLASLKSRWIPGCMCFKGLRCVNFYQMQPRELPSIPLLPWMV